jgi:hypothetical protein
MMKPPNDFLSSFLEYDFENSKNIKVMRMTLLVAGSAPSFHLGQDKMLIVSECLFDHHLIRSTEYGVSLLDFEPIVYLRV